MNKTPWAIRDVAHGKTFFFDSWEEMVAWVMKFELQSK